MNSSAVFLEGDKMTSKISGRVIIASKVASGLFLSVLLAGCGANLSLATGATEFGAVT